MSTSTTKPLISVLVPCFNSGDFIASTLDSLISQTYTNWECIIVDDNSTDNSVEIIEEYCLKYPEKIKLYSNPRQGACAARNFAFEKGNGEFIQYLDADDLLSPDKIENQVEALSKSPQKIAVCNTWHFYDEIEKANNTDSQYVFSSDDPAKLLINLWGGFGTPHLIQTNAWLIPRNLIKNSGPWNEKLYKDQDGEFFARVLLNSNGIIYTPNVKSYYRKHLQGGNISSQKQRKHIESNLLSTRKKEEYLFKFNQSNAARKAIATQYKYVAIEAWPQFKEISNIALKKCNQLGGSDYLPVLGGKAIEFIKKTMGWKMAKSVSFYGHQNKTLKRLLSKAKP